MKNAPAIMDPKAFKLLLGRVKRAVGTLNQDTQAGVVDAIRNIQLHKSTTRACQLIEAFNGGKHGIPDGRASGRVKALMQYVTDAINGQAVGYSEGKDGRLSLKLKKSFTADMMDLSVLDTPWYEREPEKEKVLLSPEQLLNLLKRLVERASDDDKAAPETIAALNQVKQEVNILVAKLGQVVAVDKADQPLFDKAREASQKKD